MNSLFAERFNVVPVAPADLAGASGLAMPPISLKNAVNVTLMLIKGAGSAAEDPVVTLRRGTGISAGVLQGPVNHAVIDRIDTKLGATIPATYSIATQAAAATFTTDGANVGVALIHIDPQEMPAGFTAIDASIPDVGVTVQLAAACWIIEANNSPPGNDQV